MQETLLEECRKSVRRLCVLYEDMDIDYQTFLDQTRIKVKFMKKQVQQSNNPVEAEETMEVLREYASIIHYYNRFFLPIAKRG